MRLRLGIGFRFGGIRALYEVLRASPCAITLALFTYALAPTFFLEHLDFVWVVKWGWYGGSE